MAASPIFENIPDELKAKRQWVLWKTIERAGKPTKVPYQTNGSESDSTDPNKWTGYKEVVDAFHKGGYDGIGFVFDSLDPFAGIDLDDCIKPDGSIKPAALKIIEALDSYTEISPSGKGVKIFVRAKVPVKIEKGKGKIQQGFESKTKDLEIEVYYGNRYFTLTGNVLPGRTTNIEERNEALTAVFKEIFKDRGYFAPPIKRVYVEVPPQDDEDARKTPPEGDFQEKLNKLFENDRPFMATFKTAAPMEGDRSAVEFFLIVKMAEAGFTEDEAYGAMMTSPQTKWNKRDDGYRKSTIRNAFARWRLKAEQEKTARAKREEILGVMPEKVADDPGWIYAVENITVIRDIFKNDPQSWARVRKILQKAKASTRDLERFLKGGSADEEDDRADFAEMAAELVVAMDIKRLPGGILAVYRGGVYVTEDSEYLIDATIQIELQKEFNTSFKANLLLHIKALAQSVTHDDFEVYQHLLCCPNGVVDLRTGELLPHDPKYMMLHMTTAEYHPDADRSLWVKTVGEILPDVDLQDGVDELGRTKLPNMEDQKDYYKRGWGYSITGETRDEIFFGHQGLGGCGKNTLIWPIQWAMGSYVQQIDPEILIAKGDHYKPDYELSTGVGKRIFITNESKEGGRIKGDMIKRMATDGALFNARQIFSKPFTYIMRAKTHLITNHPIPIPDQDDAIERRLHLIQYVMNFTKNKETVDLDLKKKLTTKEASEGVLAWLVEGAKEYYAKGMFRTKAVTVAVQEAIEQNDPLYGFVEAIFEPNPKAEVNGKYVFNTFREYCDTIGVKADRFEPHRFGRLLNAQFKRSGWTYRKRESHGTIYFVGIGEKIVPVKPTFAGSNDSEKRDEPPKQVDATGSENRCFACGADISEGHSRCGEDLCGNCGPQFAMVRGAMKAHPGGITVSALHQELADRGRAPSIAILERMVAKLNG